MGNLDLKRPFDFFFSKEGNFNNKKENKENILDIWKLSGKISENEKKGKDSRCSKA
jgi:hypothetical protein